MNPPHRVLRVAARGCTALLVSLLAFSLLFPPLYVALAPDGRPAFADIGPNDTPDAAGEPALVYVADWGYHTSVIVPQPRGWRYGPPGAEAATYVEYAWGDRRFYRDSDYRPWSLFATLVLPTASVVYLAGRDRPPTVAAGARAVYARAVDARTRARLLGELERSVRHARDGRRLPPSPPVPGYGGRFYDAYGAYLWARDCNRWTVERLRAVGLARAGGGVVFSGQVAGRLVDFTPLPGAPGTR